MSVVGIITNSSHIIELEGKTNIILINEKSIENIKNVKFDIIIIYQEIKQNEKIKNLINSCRYLVINTDIKENLKLLNGIEETNTTIITYGFNRKSSITIVSNENDEIILEIQREINNLRNEKVECQEVKMQNNSEKNQIYLAISMKILEILEKI